SSEPRGLSSWTPLFARSLQYAIGHVAYVVSTFRLRQATADHRSCSGGGQVDRLSLRWDSEPVHKVWSATCRSPCASTSTRWASRRNGKRPTRTPRQMSSVRGIESGRDRRVAS